MLFQASHAKLVVFFLIACFHPKEIGGHRERDGQSKLQLCSMWNAYNVFCYSKPRCLLFMTNMKATSWCLCLLLSQSHCRKEVSKVLILVMWLSSNMFSGSEQEIPSFKATLVSWFPPSLSSPFLLHHSFHHSLFCFQPITPDCCIFFKE